MSRNGKIMLGILTLMPYLLIGTYLFTMTFFIHDFTPVQYGKIPFPLMTNVVWLLFILIIAGLLCFGLLVYYIVHVHDNQELGQNEKTTWVVCMLLLSGIACPLYWYNRIWKTHDMLSMATS
jgi:hypothetical protein